MAWTSPMTAVANDIWTAAQFNTHVRDNLLETAPAKATTVGAHFAVVSSNTIAQRVTTHDIIPDATLEESTSSTSFTDLDTVGPQITVTTGTRALVIITCSARNVTNNAFCLAGVQLTGSTSRVAANNQDQRTLKQSSYGTTNRPWTRGCAAWIEPMTAGTTTFTMQYRVNAGTGIFWSRRMIVIPF